MNNKALYQAVIHLPKDLWPPGLGYEHPEDDDDPTGGFWTIDLDGLSVEDDEDGADAWKPSESEEGLCAVIPAHHAMLMFAGILSRNTAIAETDEAWFRLLINASR
jgi:hypothetical protein